MDESELQSALSTVESRGVSDTLNSMGDATWDLLFSPPTILDSREDIVDIIGKPGEGLGYAYPCQKNLFSKLKSFSRSFEQRTFSLYGMMVQFLSTAVNDRGNFSESTFHNTSWLRMHLLQLLVGLPSMTPLWRNPCIVMSAPNPHFSCRSICGLLQHRLTSPGI